MSKTKGRILVIRGGNLSEFILTCPVFAALRLQFPETSLEVLGYPRIARLAKSAGLVDEIHSIESRAAAGFFARNGALDPDLANFFAGFSIIFSYLFDPDHIFETNIQKVSPAQFIAGPARPREGEKIHAAEAFLKPLEKLAIFGADSIPRLSLLGSDASAPQIAIHPGREDDARNWHESKWRSLAQSIAQKTACQILVGGAEGDTRTLERITRSLPSNTETLPNDLPFAELAARLSTCQAFIGGDSGILQLAAALGIPCVAVWGTSNAAIWKPPGPNVTLLQNRAGVNAITQEEVLAALPLVRTGSK